MCQSTSLVPLSTPMINSSVDEDTICFEVDLTNITWGGYDRSIDFWYQKQYLLDANDVDEAHWNETE